MDDVFSLKGNERLYQVLGVERSATAGQIKRAYHKLAIQCHPDKSSDPADAERFKAISFAYNILSDEEQRRLYDNTSLRTHLEGHRKEYDPMMDPAVELSAEDLCRFVEKVRREHEAKAARQKEFEDRRRAEMERRAEFDRRHPDFRMPEVSPSLRSDSESIASASPLSPSGSTSVVGITGMSQAYRTTADIKEALQRLESSTPTSDDPLAHLRQPRAAAASTKSQMMSQFRSERRENGISTVAQTVAVRPDDVAHLDDQKYGFVKASTAAPNYVEAVAERVQKRSNFNYTSFVTRGYVDGGVVGDAILADALSDYDPNR